MPPGQVWYRGASMELHCCRTELLWQGMLWPPGCHKGIWCKGVKNAAQLRTSPGGLSVCRSDRLSGAELVLGLGMRNPGLPVDALPLASASSAGQPRSKPCKHFLIQCLLRCLTEITGQESRASGGRGGGSHPLAPPPSLGQDFCKWGFSCSIWVLIN